jgi:hypothetical protein
LPAWSFIDVLHTLVAPTAFPTQHLPLIATEEVLLTSVRQRLPLPLLVHFPHFPAQRPGPSPYRNPSKAQTPERPQPSRLRSSKPLPLQILPTFKAHPAFFSFLFFLFYFSGFSVVLHFFSVLPAVPRQHPSSISPAASLLPPTLASIAPIHHPHHHHHHYNIPTNTVNSLLIVHRAYLIQQSLSLHL